MFNLTALSRGTAGVVMGLALAMPVFAQKPLDFVLGGMPPKESAGEKLVFRINELSAIQLVPREGGVPNQHPRVVEPEVIRQQLSALRLTPPKGAVEPLFGEAESADLAEPIARALAAAKPDQDLLLLSTSRRDGSYFSPPVGLTARLFVANDRLNVIVHDARNEYYSRWRGTSIRPDFTFGSRTAASKTNLLAQAGVLQRPDWAALPLVPLAADPAKPAVAPAPVVVQVAPYVAPAAAPAAVAPAPAAAPAVAPSEAENRLRTLKRLRDGGLISEEEFQQKRAEVLKAL
ncbi:SHOCT domain-containing protein [Rhizobacter sp. Root1221]|uniref:SHOCT domain-containing protein n=1 Tax=Rhizobacter sp. Root1221 TaxID=1736433 RepID=UPI0006F77D6A|nr:SHOCT domain-containing protein [Rhizobacter sp. Root1221]KQW00253.1 hypothetical protein ASC87_18425 [Rhizobacter sp. Root1221]